MQTTAYDGLDLQRIPRDPSWEDSPASPHRGPPPTFRIPRAVIEEIGAGCSDDPAVKWLKNPSLADHIVDAPTAPPFLIQWDLGAGETAVLSLALAENGAVTVNCRVSDLLLPP